jgi:hypothetical protein
LVKVAVAILNFVTLKLTIMEFKCIKSQLVENPIVAASTKSRFYFPTQNFLRLKQIVSIEILTNLDASQAPSGNDVTTGADLISGYLTLYGDNPEAANAQGEWVQQIPLISLHRINNGVDPFVFGLFNMLPRNIVWEKSYVETFPALTPDTDTSFLFQVGYLGNEGDN